MREWWVSCVIITQTAPEGIFWSTCIHRAHPVQPREDPRMYAELLAGTKQYIDTTAERGGCIGVSWALASLLMQNEVLLYLAEGCRSSRGKRAREWNNKRT